MPVNGQRELLRQIYLAVGQYRFRVHSKATTPSEPQEIDSNRDCYSKAAEPLRGKG
jgi:hypothetical protein